jgi:hypothetical protein
MVRDDLQACLQAYQFAELLLSGAQTKSAKEREEAVEAAKRLFEEVHARYEDAVGSNLYRAEQLQAMQALRARIEERLRA